MTIARTVRRALVLAAIAAIAAAGATGCANPRQAAYLNDQMNQAAEAIADVRTTMSVLQSSVDSLIAVVAKQDSTIARLAIATNVQVVK